MKEMQPSKTEMSLFKKLGFIVLGMGSSLIFLSLLILGTLFFLSSGNGFSHERVTSWLEDRANLKVPQGYSISLKEARFNRDGETLGLKANSLQLKSAEGKVLLDAPEVQFNFDLVSIAKDIITDQSPLKSIAVKGANLTVIKKNDGSFSLDIGSDSKFEAPSLEEAVKSAVAVLGQLSQSGFSSVRFNESLITLHNESDGALLKRISLDMSLIKDRNNTLFLNLIDKDNGASIFKAEVTKANGLYQLETAPLNFRLSKLHGVLPSRYNPAKFDLDIQFSAKMVIDESNNTLKAFQSNLTIGNGFVNKAGKYPRDFVVNSGALALSWVEGRSELNIDKLTLDMPPWKADLRGVTTIDKLKSSFLLTQGQIEVFDKQGKNPILFDTLAAKGVLDLEKPALSLEQASLKGKLAEILAKTNIEFTGETPRLQLHLETGRMKARTFIQLWPEVVSPNVRKWIDERVISGDVEPALLKTNMPANILAPDNVVLEKDMLLVEAKLKNVVVKPLSDLAPVQAPDAIVYVDGKVVKVTSNKAFLDSKKGKPLEASFISFEIPDTSPHTPLATIKVKAFGEASALATVLSGDTFKGVTTFTLDPESEIKGQANADFTLNLQLSNQLKKTDVNYKAEIDFKNFTQSDVVRDLDLEQANFKVIATSKDFYVKGEGKIGGQQANFEIKQPKLGVKPLIELTATLDEKGRARFGLSSGGRIVGSTPIKISSINDDSGTYKIEADLTPVALNDLIPGWNKPVGAPAKVKLTAIDNEPGWKVDDIQLESKSGILVKGALVIDGQGQMFSANFPTYHINTSDKASIKLEKIANGYKVFLNASVIDLRPLMKTLLSASNSVGLDKNANKGALFIEAKVNLAAGLNGEMMRNVALKAQRVNGEVRYIEATGRVGKGAFKVEMLKENKNNWLAASAEDAGSWLRFFDIYSSLYGGYLSLALAPPKADGSISAGAFEIDNFAIKGDGAIGGIVASADIKDERKGLSLDERQKLIREKAQNAPTDLSNFVKMKAEFSRSAQGVLNVEKGLIWGPAVGATMEGKLDFPRNRIAMTGTYVPAYALNNIFAKLPIIGIFLGGGSDQGLIGVNYEMTGSIKAPELQINPLSALAPGILRRMLDFRSHANSRDREALIPPSSSAN